MNGLFNSKLSYAISAWGCVWDLPGVLDMEKRNSPSLTRHESHQLQVLHNKVMRLATGLPWDTSLKTLLKESGQLSVQQLTAYHSLLQVYKTQRSKQPAYIFNRLFTNHNEDHLQNGPESTLGTSRSQTNKMTRIDQDLSLARSSFFYRASKLWNDLPLNLRNQVKLASFKSGVKTWIRANVKGAPK